MPDQDPIGDPAFREDVVLPDVAPRRPGIPQPAKPKQADQYQAHLDRQRAELQSVLATPQGRSFIMGLIGACHIYDRPTLSAEEQGRRALGLGIIARLVDLGPKTYANLLADHADRMQALADAADATNARKV